jgi:hypothetical protein
VEQEYGSVGHGYHVLQRYGDTVHGYYRLHGGKVVVTFYGPRVGELDFATPYYRTKGGFGVGSTIPLGPCHRTAANPCEHRWHGARSLRPVNATNFAKPWFFIYLSRGRVAELYFALRYID